MAVVQRCIKQFTSTLFFVAMFFSATAFPQKNTHVQLASANQISASNGFIAAFEMSPETGFTFTWPYESMRPASYGTLLVKVKKLPRVFYENSRQSKPLMAARALRVNGKLQTPLRSKADKVSEQFAVSLHQGRLRFSLEIPEGATIDSGAKTVRIELYEVNRPTAR